MFEESRPDMVPLDVLMPARDGIEAIRETRKVDPAAVVFKVTGGRCHTGRIFSASEARGHADPHSPGKIADPLAHFLVRGMGADHRRDRRRVTYEALREIEVALSRDRPRSTPSGLQKVWVPGVWDATPHSPWTLLSTVTGQRVSSHLNVFDVAPGGS